jgi:uncharacterized protein YdeI (YjbR/CyaY-like superfamily)
MAARPKRSAGTKISNEPHDVKFFRTQAAWRAWLEKNHRTVERQWVGFHRVASGKPSITWPQSVDEALCFGWIDGLRRGLDSQSYAIRFSPRGTKSLWSKVNLRRFAELEQARQVRAAGRAARAQWDDTASAGYSYEKPIVELDAAALDALRAKPRAWSFWQAQVPSYRKICANWVTSAKREETRRGRLETLVSCCAKWAAIPGLAKWMKVKKPAG